MKTSQCMLYTWLTFASVFVLLPSLAAQTAGTGALTGTVTDPTGAVVPNVTVTATSTDTGQLRTTVTGPNGFYSIGLLSPGTYRVKFDSTGFKAAEVSSVTVTVTETQVLDQHLEVGSQTEQVTVTGEAETVQTSNATVGTVMTSQTVTGLPLNTRNYTALLGLSAGANTGVFNASTLGKGSQDIAVNGASVAQNNLQMDGVSVTNFTGNGNIADLGNNSGVGVVNPDAIQEFKIQTSLYDAGYGRNPGANVNVVTKSGTNAFHGTAFEFFRNTDLNANDFFRKITLPVNGVPNNGRQVLNQNQYGGVFGGPVKKDKVFFFVSYQETWQKNGVAAQGYSVPVLPPIPTGDRSNTAAFTNALGGVFCPTGTAGGTTQNGGVQVLCNGSNINPVAVNILQLKNPDGSYYVPSSGTGKYQNATFSIPALYKEHQAAGSLDYVINAKNTLSFRYFFTTNPTNVPFGCSASGGAPGICLPDTAVVQEFSNENGVAKLTTILTNNLVNEARFSLQRFFVNLSYQVPFTDSQVGIAPIVPTINPLDFITIATRFTIGTPGNYPNDKRATAVEWADQLSWNHNKHTIRAGFEYERDRLNWRLVGLANGNLTFQTFQDFLLGLPGCTPGNALCTTANPGGTNGTASSNISSTGTTTAAVPPGGVIHGLRSPFADAFVQDDIKLTQRFTLNLGLRWEYDGIIHDKYGQATNIWPSLIETVPVPGTTPATGSLAGFVVPSNYNPAINPAPTVGGLFQNNRKVPTMNSPSIDNFAPRIGFAWQPLASNRFVVRAGFGYFYDRVGQNSYYIPFVQGVPYAVSVFQSGSANYYSTLAVPYQNTALAWTPRWVNFQAGTSSNLSDQIMEQIVRAPLVDEWNLNLQYEFLPSWVLEVGYVGSHGIHQATSGRQINEAQLASPSNPICGQGTCITTNTTGNASLRVPYLGFSPAGLTEAGSDGDEKFNSLQATVRKQLSHGLTLQAAYTWSRALTTGALTSNDPNNTAQQYGLNPSYRPQRLAVNYSWDLPFGNRQGIEGKLTNGWTLSGVTIIQDGTPLTITDTRGGTVYGFGGSSPVISRAQFAAGMGNANIATPGGVEARLGGSTLGGPGYLNAAAFGTTPVLGDDKKATGYGNSGVGVILGPGQFNWDVSLVKTTTVGGLREDATLQFRAELFNTFNHAQFNNPAVVDVSKTATFGQITSASVNPRLIQFALKYAF